ncbi:hypothetical protein M5D96_008584 [Drosophila gunungcola]|uniref:Kazal-like domain-containing protein n=1 Tax=Drosophila gunungcola TaxID=103775 RepID=A0A9Q0BNT7_9MUSC|nr:hypothetical protein M5D96_008584 [Drosophila gunungcola]
MDRIGILGIALLLIGIVHSYPANSNPPGELIQRPPTSQQLRACIASCSTTSENNPVCGTNNQSYSNENKLICASYCGLNIGIAYHGNCRKAPRASIQ